jgi:hypothetical protein
VTLHALKRPAHGCAELGLRCESLGGVVSLRVHTTLGYSEDSSDTGGILSVKKGLHTTSIALM